jgi:hypothetical protein
MAAMSDYLEQQLRTHIFRTGSFTKPSGLFVALCTAATSDSSTGKITETKADPLDIKIETDPKFKYGDDKVGGEDLN